MRLVGLIFIALVAVAQPAVAQSGPDRVGPPPPVRPRAPIVTAPKADPLPTTRPTQSFASGGIAGALTGLQPIRPFPPLVGLPPAGDQAPQCRAACAKVHNQCAGQGEETCDTNWTQCIRGCSARR